MRRNTTIFLWMYYGSATISRSQTNKRILHTVNNYRRIKAGQPYYVILHFFSITHTYTYVRTHIIHLVYTNKHEGRVMVGHGYAYPTVGFP